MYFWWSDNFWDGFILNKTAAFGKKIDIVWVIFFVFFIFYFFILE